MTLEFWWLGLLVLVAVAVGTARWVRRQPAPARGALVANTDVIRQTPRYRALMRRYLRWTLVQLVSVCLLGLGGWLLASRLALAGSGDAEQHNRDIMLCLDVSGSMLSTDAAMMNEFAKITRDLRGERIGLTIWDSSAVSKFPLTNDYEFLATQLEAGARELGESAYGYTRGTNAGDGSSLIGDGVASCLERFDQPESDRARTMILATDNEVSGDPVYPLAQAFELVRQRTVVVFALNDYDTTNFKVLRQEATSTGGGGFILSDAGAAGQVVTAIQSQEARRMQGARQHRVTDLPVPGLTLMSLGLVGLAVSGRRLRR